MSSRNRKVSTEIRAAPSDPAPLAPVPELSLDHPSLYLNRELSLLEFQRRVLEEVRDERSPLLERAKFLAIFGSNIDEFFMVRVAGLKHQMEAAAVELTPGEDSPALQLRAIRERVLELMTQARLHLMSKLLPALTEAGVHVLCYNELTAEEKEQADRYFEEIVFPTLTPLAFDPGRPFPHISNLSLNLAVLIGGKRNKRHFARVKVPDSLPQLIPLTPSNPTTRRRRQRRSVLVWLEDVIAANLKQLFPGMDIIESHPFHVTRDADIAIQDLEASDLLEQIEEGVRLRRFGSVVRLNVNEAMPDHILDILVQNLELEPIDVYKLHGPLALTRFMEAYKIDRPDLKDAPFIPRVPPEASPPPDEDLFSIIRRRDFLLHHPFDSFQPVVQFLEQAAYDPNVLAIKMTLYRVGRNSPVVKALLEAMRNGKQVAVLVELKARFDEESNIEWARALEKEGVHVVYGLLGLKIHSKIALVVRSEGDRIRRYVHLGTGNYNAVTAHQYTDLGLFTADERIGADATDLFNFLTGYSAKVRYRKLMVAPVNFRQRFEQLIEREIRHHRESQNGRIILKMNALVDKEIIRLLYEASRAGVRIDLLVRGICILRPGLPEVSENIRVISIVGRFLEHTRIYWFHNNGKPETYAGSADLMPRNIDRRVEVVFPVEDPGIAKRIYNDILLTYLKDTVKARWMLPDGSYERINPEDGADPFSSQEWMLPRGYRVESPVRKSRQLDD